MPSVGSSMPNSIRMSVVLPLPLCPISEDAFAGLEEEIEGATPGHHRTTW